LQSDQSIAYGGWQFAYIIFIAFFVLLFLVTIFSLQSDQSTTYGGWQSAYINFIAFFVLLFLVTRFSLLQSDQSIAYEGWQLACIIFIACCGALLLLLEPLSWYLYSKKKETNQKEHAQPHAKLKTLLFDCAHFNAFN